MDIRDEQRTAKDIEAVITSYNQGDMIIEAVHSLCEQTVLPSSPHILSRYVSCCMKILQW